MLFSTKLLFPIFAVFSLATFAFASPVAAPVDTVDIAKRQSSDAVSELQAFQSSVTPLIDQLSQAAATSADTTDVVNQLFSAFTDSTNSFKAKPGHLADIDIDVFVKISLDIVIKLVVALSKLPILNLFIGAKIDVFLNAWLSALNVLSPGIAPKIGKSIPAANLTIFALLKLLLSAKVLAIIDNLGIITL